MRDFYKHVLIPESVINFLIYIDQLVLQIGLLI